MFFRLVLIIGGGGGESNKASFFAFHNSLVREVSQESLLLIYRKRDETTEAKVLVQGHAAESDSQD